MSVGSFFLQFFSHSKMSDKTAEALLEKHAVLGCWRQK